MRATQTVFVLLMVLSVGCTSFCPHGKQSDVIRGRLDDHVAYSFARDHDSIEVQVSYDSEQMGWFLCTTNYMNALVSPLRPYGTHYDDIGTVAHTNTVKFVHWSRRGETRIGVLDLDGDGLADRRTTMTATNRVTEDITHQFTVRSSRPRNVGKKNEKSGTAVSEQSEETSIEKSSQVPVDTADRLADPQH